MHFLMIRRIIQEILLPQMAKHSLWFSCAGRRDASHQSMTIRVMDAGCKYLRVQSLSLDIPNTLTLTNLSAFLQCSSMVRFIRLLELFIP